MCDFSWLGGGQHVGENYLFHVKPIAWQNLIKHCEVSHEIEK